MKIKYSYDMWAGSERIEVNDTSFNFKGDILKSHISRNEFTKKLNRGFKIESMTSNVKKLSDGIQTYGVNTHRRLGPNEYWSYECEAEIFDGKLVLFKSNEPTDCIHWSF